MNAITRGRTVAAAGVLAASTLLGTALAAGPAMEHEGHAAMQQDSRTGMQGEGTLAAVRKFRPAPQHEAKPAPQHDATLTAMVDEAAPAGMPVE